jgi:hypothetical protein
MSTTAARPDGAMHCPVVELRQYTLKPGRRDVLIDIFERHFIEPQEAAGARILGHFRDLDATDRFVWLRGFRDMPSRKLALEAFYGGEVWGRHREAANETMIDSDNVLLLRPARPGSGFQSGRQRDQGGAEHDSLVVATICSLDAAPPDRLVEFLDQDLRLKLAEADASLLATFVTEPAENNFPRLPVREGENVVVWFARFPDRDAYGSHVSALERWPAWHEVAQGLQRQSLRLLPAKRSQLA